ncbi:MAG: hypothetical protein A2X19_01515 [Bacteroidetes bacterium GWE2_39_28]|nr:MAG: hypothetical protein A2X19_01515 [Bacteroidetes bacterium GWE2_39_28]OFY15804.1 MAG: hypothetical protein A2X16_01785 [Bacteroidetes bacterium GWF2_39_10]OFZ09972.1 MAG: hypothetical protein A2465_06725 [Bacteroidetes bacterium RIFOXYC2_FULL_39_11]HCT93515.1 serine/threonine protein phosphatase [Rikenellaceae bacterium]
MKKGSLSYKIISRILLFCIALGFSIFSLYYFFTRDSIKKSTRSNAELTAHNSVSKIEEIIKQAEQLPQNLAWMLESNSIDLNTLDSFLIKLVENNPSIYASAIAYEPFTFDGTKKYYSPYAYKSGGSVKSIYLGSEDYNYFLMDWYQIPSMLKEPYWSEPYYDDGGGDALLSTFSVPFYIVKNRDRIFGGIITVDISLEWLTDIVNSVNILETGYAFLISRNGVFVTHPNHSFIMNESIFTIAKEKQLPQLREIGRDMIAGKSDLIKTVLDDYEQVWVYHTQLPSTKWALGVVYPHKEMYSSLYRLNLLILLLGAAGLTILISFTIRIINRQVDPLTKFAKSARLIAEGNFETELPSLLTSLEIKELHDSFEYLKKELTRYIADLQETTSAKEKIESELRIAKEIQMGMIPNIFPPFPDLKEFDLYASLESAKEVGGDLYDFFMLDKQHLCFAIGDVSGKGVPASLFMAVTRTLLRSVANMQIEANEIISSINRTLSISNDSSMFVTFFIGILNINNGRLKYCNAGHNPPVIIKSSDQINFFGAAKAIPLGLFEDIIYKQEEIILNPGDQIFLYTDGLTEAENSNQELFGEKALLEILRNGRNCDPKTLIKKVLEGVSTHVDGHTQSDDLTTMCIIYYGKGNHGNRD